jgi:hypothetical protein
MELTRLRLGRFKDFWPREIWVLVAFSSACGRHRVCVSPHSFSQSVSMLCLPHQKILEDQIPFAARQWSAATTALYLAINRIGSGFDFHDTIKCVAGRAMERGWLRSHDTPPTLSFSVIRINLHFH